MMTAETLAETRRPSRFWALLPLVPAVFLDATKGVLPSGISRLFKLDADDFVEVAFSALVAFLFFSWPLALVIAGLLRPLNYASAAVAAAHPMAFVSLADPFMATLYITGAGIMLRPRKTWFWIPVFLLLSSIPVYFVPAARTELLFSNLGALLPIALVASLAAWMAGGGFKTLATLMTAAIPGFLFRAVPFSPYCPGGGWMERDYPVGSDCLSLVPEPLPALGLLLVMTAVIATSVFLTRPNQAVHHE